MRAAVLDLGLDLRDISVLTEAASGSYAVTSLLALLAGAPRVVAVTRDSNYGTAERVMAYVAEWAARLGVAGGLYVTAEPAHRFAPDSTLVTNLGFVRPLSEALIAGLPKDAAVALMVEPWEVRTEDVDLAACRTHGVPALGPWESHPRLQIFRYVGLVVLKLLLEVGIEAYRSRVLIVGSGPFGTETRAVLDSIGAVTLLVDPTTSGWWQEPGVREFCAGCDAIALVEYRGHPGLISGECGLPADWIGPGTRVLHVSGTLNIAAAHADGMTIHPAGPAQRGHMKVLTHYVGPRPVIDLHAGGLKVGELLVRGRRATGTREGAIQHALRNPIALAEDAPCG